MNRLDELIQELCPNGVEFKKVRDVFQRLKGTPITAGKMKEIETLDGEIRVFAGGKTVINAREEDIPNANITRVPAVLVQSRGVIDVVYYEKPFTFKNEMWAYTADNKTTVKFLYYVLKNNVQKFRDAASGMGSLPQISLPVTEEFIMPLPPLQVQREIVRILDNFTELTENLTEKLTDELTTRKKQYEYYRNKLLNFEGTFKERTNDVIYRPLGEICDVRDGTHDSPKPTSKGKYLITSKNVKNGVIDYTGAYFISDEDYRSINIRSKVDTWDILFTMIGTIGEVGLVAYEPDFAIKNVGLIKTGNELLARFLRHYLACDTVKAYIDANRSKGTQAFLALGKLRELPVPVISETVMKKLVHVLDNFNAICSELSIGLLAEIEARTKQYEYYRDKLLTFKEAT